MPKKLEEEEEKLALEKEEGSKEIETINKKDEVPTPKEIEEGESEISEDVNETKEEKIESETKRDLDSSQEINKTEYSTEENHNNSPLKFSEQTNTEIIDDVKEEESTELAENKSNFISDGLEAQPLTSISESQTSEEEIEEKSTPLSVISHESHEEKSLLEYPNTPAVPDSTPQLISRSPYSSVGDLSDLSARNLEDSTSSFDSLPSTEETIKVQKENPDSRFFSFRQNRRDTYDDIDISIPTRSDSSELSNEDSQSRPARMKRAFIRYSVRVEQQLQNSFVEMLAKEQHQVTQVSDSPQRYLHYVLHMIKVLLDGSELPSSDVDHIISTIIVKYKTKTRLQSLPLSEAQKKALEMVKRETDLFTSNQYQLDRIVKAQSLIKRWLIRRRYLSKSKGFWKVGQ